MAVQRAAQDGREKKGHRKGERGKRNDEGKKRRGRGRGEEEKRERNDEGKKRERDAINFSGGSYLGCTKSSLNGLEKFVPL